ncbi:MAG: ABC transporter permease, partial [Mycobacteriales bacterium]
MSTPTPPVGLSATSAIRLVAVREIRTRVMTKAFVIGNGLFLLLIVGGLTLTAVLSDGPNKPVKIGVVGEASQLEPALKAAGESLRTKVEISKIPSAAAAEQALLKGDVKASLSVRGEGFVARADKNLNDTLRALLTSAVQQSAVSSALVKQGVDPGTLAAAAAKATLDIQFLHPPRKDADQRTALAFAVVALLYLQLLGNGVAVATGVVEEKTTRVVELLLAAIKPLHLLAGKVIGIGVVGLIQLAAYGVVGLGSAAASGLLSLSAPAVLTFVSALGWYVLG